jgi:type IV pilus biogenesis protein PilP
LPYDDDEPEAVAAAPNIPTSASVARQATIRNAIALRDINLIGVYGTERDRRALVRMPNGRYVKVKVGDRLDGGQIAAIGRNQLRYVKGGRNITLTVPSG